MFLHLSVILFTGGWVSTCWDTPPGQIAPKADTPLDRQTDTHTRADTSLGRHPPGRHPPRQTPPFGYYRIWTKSGQYATGMHTSLLLIYFPNWYLDIWLITWTYSITGQRWTEFSARDCDWASITQNSDYINTYCDPTWVLQAVYSAMPYWLSDNHITSLYFPVSDLYSCNSCIYLILKFAMLTWSVHCEHLYSGWP